MLDAWVGVVAALRIGVNALLLSTRPGYRRAGVSRYIERLVRALPTALGAEDDLVAYGVRGTSAPAPELERAWRPAPSWLPVEQRMVRIPWEQAVLPLLTRRDRLDVFHAPVNVAPLLAPCPTVVTVHDLAFLREPGRLPARRRRYLTTMTRASVRRAARVLAVSEYTKNDLLEAFGVPPDRVVVTPLAVDETFSPPSLEALAVFRAKHGLAGPFVLYVGTLEPRKNVPGLLRAFAEIVTEVPHELVLVGAQGWMTEEIDRALSDVRLEGRVRVTGYADDAELPLWYGAADLFVYPPFYEGFGLPPLEAMACGTPVVASAVSSLPEVADDAALLVDPADREALADAMRRVLTDPALAAELRTRGRTRAARCSWARTAVATVVAYREAAG